MEQSTAQIIQECRWGKRNAQLAMYRLYARRLYATCLRVVGRPEEAEEAMQDAFLKIFQKLEAGLAIDNLEGWMRQVAVHTAIDYVRRQQPVFDELSDNWAEPEEGPDEEEIHYTVERVKQAIQRLSAGHRIILSLYLFEGYDLEEIAGILNVRPSSARSQYMRAKRRLLNELNEDHHG